MSVQATIYMLVDVSDNDKCVSVVCTDTHLSLSSYTRDQSKIVPKTVGQVKTDWTGGCDGTPRPPTVVPIVTADIVP